MKQLFNILISAMCISFQTQAQNKNFNQDFESLEKDDIHVYGEDKVKEPGENKWKTHKLEFTVIEGREKVALQVYRWAEGVTLNIDDFKLIKK